VELLDVVGIPEPQRCVRYHPHQLSGGQRRRVVLALALAGNPALLIVGEPTTALDVAVQVEILALLREVRDHIDAGILLITHDVGVVADLADRVVVVHGGRVVEQQEMYALIARPAIDRTRRLVAADPVRQQIRRLRLAAGWQP
jgi:peptide/nickel transport system ATP-binding protein